MGSTRPGAASTFRRTPRWRAWLRAARPLAQGNIAPAIVLGQALAWALERRFSIGGALIAHAFGVLAQLVIVLGNDYADRDADRANSTFNAFSGGSRVLPEGMLEPDAVRRAALGAAIAIVALGAISDLAFGSRGLSLLALATLALVHGYSYAPLRLSYRGGGEVLQGLGVGVVLPMVGLAAHGASPLAAGSTLAGTFVIATIANVITALPDEPADRAADKRTWAVRRGGRAARRDLLIALPIAYVLAALLLPVREDALRIATAAVPAIVLLPALPLYAYADAQERSACLRFVVACGASVTAWLLIASMALVLDRG